MPSPEALPSPSGRESAHHPSPPYDEKVDVWAVGILLHELLVGRTPFEVNDATETAAAIMASPLPLAPLQHLTPDCIGFLSLALEKKASLRPSAAELSRHIWLQRHLRSLAPNAGPKLQSLDIFELTAVRRAIHEAW